LVTKVLSVGNESHLRVLLSRTTRGLLDISSGSPARIMEWWVLEYRRRERSDANLREHVPIANWEET